MQTEYILIFCRARGIPLSATLMTVNSSVFSRLTEGFSRVGQCVLSLQEVMLAGPIYTQHQLCPSLPPSLSLSLFLHLSLPVSLPPSLPPFICSRDRALVWSSLYFPVLCSFPAVQNEFAYGKYTDHAMWKSPIRPAVCSCYQLSRLYLVLDRPPC